MTNFDFLKIGAHHSHATKRMLATFAALGAIGLAGACGTPAGTGAGSGSSSGAGPASGASSGSTSGSAGQGSGSGGGGPGASGGTSGASTGRGAADSGVASSGVASSGAAGSGAAGSGGAGSGSAPVDGGSGFNGPVFYVTLNDGSLYAFQEGTWAQLAKWTGLPILDSVRGSDAEPKTGILYFTHGGSGPNSNGPKKTGGLLAWSLLTNSIVFDVQFTHGVDQPSVGSGVVYVPSGEYTNDTNWYTVKASDGSPIGMETGGKNPHDTIYKNGHRYYGGTQDTYLYVLGLPITKVGPSPSGTAGVRPYTVNGKETRAYITWSNFRGFSVGDLTTGKILSTVNFGGNSCGLAAPSHGMSLSPDNSEVYVLDTCVNQLRVYDSSDAPQLKATVTLAHNIHPGKENPCVWDCDKDGWIMHSRDGKYVYVGDSGDVIDTATHQPTAFIAPLSNCRHGFVELDWSNGVITDTSTHVGLGY